MQDSIDLTDRSLSLHQPSKKEMLARSIRSAVFVLVGMSQASFSVLPGEVFYMHELTQKGFVHTLLGEVRLFYHPEQSPLTPEWIAAFEHTMEHYPAHISRKYLRFITLRSHLVNDNNNSIDGRVFESLGAMELEYHIWSARARENVIHHEMAHLIVPGDHPMWAYFDQLYHRSEWSQDFWPTRVTVEWDLYARSSVKEDIAVTAEALFFDGGYHWRTRSPLAHQKYYLLKQYYQWLGIRMRVGQYDEYMLNKQK